MRAIDARVVVCPRANMPKACQLLIFTCQRPNKHAKMPTSQRCANISTWRTNVPNACQCLSLACQRAKKHTKFSTSPVKRAANFSTNFSTEETENGA